MWCPLPMSRLDVRHISFATTHMCDLNRGVVTMTSALSGGTTNSIEGSELTGGYTVICPCVLGFIKKHVLFYFDKRQTKTKFKIRDLSVVRVSQYLPGLSANSRFSYPRMPVYGPSPLEFWIGGHFPWIEFCSKPLPYEFAFYCMN